MEWIDLTGALCALIALTGAVVASRLIPWLNCKTTAEEREHLLRWVEIAVGAAQQLYHQSQGKQRLQYALELLEGEGADYRIRVRCSKGTYVRTLCHDIGQRLGCGGCMSSLRRTRAGVYELAQSVTMEALLRHEDPVSLLLPVDSLFAHLPAVTVREGQLKLIYNGAAVKMPQLAEGEYRVYAPDGEFLMVGAAKKGLLHTVKSFFEVK